MMPARLRSTLYRQLAQVSTRFGYQLSTDVFRSILGLHVPHLIDYVVASSGSYTLMSWIDGDCCNDIWGELTPMDKARLIAELRAQIHFLRKHTIGRSRTIRASSGAPVSDPRVPWIADDGPRIFSIPSDFFKQVWLGLDYPRQRDTIKPIIQPLVDREDVPIVFCYGDLLPKNIILPGGLARWRAGTTPLYPIDWEYSDEEQWYGMMREVFPDYSAELEADWLWWTKSGIPIV
ncbi:hypothetical protein L226DRAFT_542479 [Lentinus tigrinus ALCF2SS1-7]|uniref:Aminoglycoside phosphotransferase domain-containing protein n=1 Tax=Lentinus tigrinus ALCF2SS1-6 TaxID=1328759 RepID=A0A5C2SVV2_9APHY|nr:hypothetical protein L227DRAFT_582674 [Lentinus tigrinus ALCF2SS1-6]RPD81323.1 hypothetical protein L226DRAFT_542479 [Lentinus tigrinus ALCF2SS1-7]